MPVWSWEKSFFPVFPRPAQTQDPGEDAIPDRRGAGTHQQISASTIINQGFFAQSSLHLVILTLYRNIQRNLLVKLTKSNMVFITCVFRDFSLLSQRFFVLLCQPAGRPEGNQQFLMMPVTTMPMIQLMPMI